MLTDGIISDTAWHDIEIIAFMQDNQAHEQNSFIIVNIRLHIVSYMNSVD